MVQQLELSAFTAMGPGSISGQRTKIHKLLGVAQTNKQKPKVCSPFSSGSSGKAPACQCRRNRQETWVQFLGQKDPLEEEMATHSSIFAWEIPWTEEPGGLQSMGSQRVGHH